MHVVEAGKAREIVYDASYFEMPANSPARDLPAGAGFAGFRLQESRSGHPGRDGGALDWKTNDWVAFLGASYFRAIGELYQYGLSARGVAIDPAVSGKLEEFPDFTHIWLETPQAGAEHVVVYALLSGPSIAGAYRFRMHRGKGVTMEIETTLHLRKDVSRLGITPLTSMFWYSEPPSRRRSTGAPRCMIPMGSRSGPGRASALAPPQQSAAHHGLGLRRQ